MASSKLGEVLRTKYHKDYDFEDFLPSDALDEILTKSAIQDVLGPKLQCTNDDMEFIVARILDKNAALGYKKIFAILVLIGKAKYIKYFIKEGIRDRDLPVEYADLTRRLDNCKQHHLDIFCKRQWSVFVPVLDFTLNGGVTKYSAHERLPFLERERIGSHAYGTLMKVRIHPGHIRGNSSQASYFAVKEFWLDSRPRWEDELNALQHFSGQHAGHEHLIKLLFAYEHEGVGLFLVFPRADGNLNEYWELNSSPRPEDAHWLIQQCWGLATALCQVHRYDSRDGKDRGGHGDINPENILWFKGTGTNRDRLVVTYFTPARFHTNDMVENTTPGNRGFSYAYRPPEVDVQLETKSAQRFYVWSLGCLFLEFLVWYLVGYPAIRGRGNIVDYDGQKCQTFIDARVNDDDRFADGFAQDKFFNTTGGEVGPAYVKNSVIMWIKFLNRLKSCSGAIHDLLGLIEDSMLRPEPRDRIDMDQVSAKLTNILARCSTKEYYAQGLPRRDIDRYIYPPLFRRKLYPIESGGSSQSSQVAPSPTPNKDLVQLEALYENASLVTAAPCRTHSSAPDNGTALGEEFYPIEKPGRKAKYFDRIFLHLLSRSPRSEPDNFIFKLSPKISTPRQGTILMRNVSTKTKQDSREAALVHFVDVRDRCIPAARDSGLPLTNPRFLPRTAASNFLQEHRIRATLNDRLKDVEETDLDDLVTYVRDGANLVFLTLVLSGTLKYIRPLRSAGFVDQNLPVGNDSHSEVVTLKTGQKHECFSHEKWTPERKESFIENQWAFLAPVLSSNEFAYSLHVSQPLPFVPPSTVSFDEGRFGLVSKVLISAGHHDYSQGDTSGNFQVALKCLKDEMNLHEMETLYKKERQTLEFLRGLRHPHLIQAYAAYKRGNERGFVFPWADGGNLRQFWMSNGTPLDRELLLWGIAQMRGLADGISKLHGEGIRHGDIKPGNILVFPDGTNQWGTLVLADVGLAKSHDYHTRRRNTPTTTAFGSRRYESPEVNPGLLSRKYDIWSLGCVFLEFLIWLLRGPDGLNLFLEESNENGNETRFWELTSPSPRLRKVIIDYMENISVSLKRGSSIPVLIDLLALIQARLLIVDVEHRASATEILRQLELLEGKIPPDSVTHDPMQRSDLETPCAKVGLPELPNTPSRKFQLLRKWLSLCDETHECNQRLQGSGDLVRMPTRVLDVGSENNPYVRLLKSSEGLGGNYIALSHCWGSFNKDVDFCTRRSNISAFMDNINFRTLPETFQDAVTVTRALALRYLWIDSLCIIQDDEADWEFESKRMEDVYSSAYLTIAAASAKSSREGFLGTRSGRQWVTIATPKGPWCCAESIDDFQTDVENSILNTRAWVLQERVLSRRTIHFTSTQMYWECGKGVHCESLAQLRNPRSQFLGDHDFPRSALTYFKNERILLIQYLYTVFSKLQVTRPTDRPVALLGLQKRIERTLETRVDYGVVERYLHRSMLWCAKVPCTLSPIKYRNDRLVPSWSWMAYSGEIDYLKIPFGKVQWTSDLESPFGGHPIRRFRKRSILAIARKVPKRAEDVFGTMVLDTNLRQGFNEDQWLYITVGKHKMANRQGEIRYYVLLIRRAPEKRDHAIYERIGVGVLDASSLPKEQIKVSLR
ncbi:hypothetical protein O1611_g4308 [Lasiodiplodia mahajangana]|uniref:Uncharacterized protein n=1 Tax=Lasiodiplodia mahajangana TaxID=1108764 RepID=A0ACC2JPN6_9PEZI|nr:hypothetical protein O1611_g4308 [Lasiodiplodia mahajangana]